MISVIDFWLFGNADESTARILLDKVDGATARFLLDKVDEATARILLCSYLLTSFALQLFVDVFCFAVICMYCRNATARTFV